MATPTTSEKMAFEQYRDSLGRHWKKYLSAQGSSDKQYHHQMYRTFATHMESLARKFPGQFTLEEVKPTAAPLNESLEPHPGHHYRGVAAAEYQAAVHAHTKAHKHSPEATSGGLDGYNYHMIGYHHHMAEHHLAMARAHREYADKHEVRGLPENPDGPGEIASNLKEHIRHKAESAKHNAIMNDKSEFGGSVVWDKDGVG